MKIYFRKTGEVFYNVIKTKTKLHKVGNNPDPLEKPYGFYVVKLHIIYLIGEKPVEKIFELFRARLYRHSKCYLNALNKQLYNEDEKVTIPAPEDIIIYENTTYEIAFGGVWPNQPFP